MAADEAQTPVEWDDETNLKWSVDLPGRGKSCPIVVGDRVIVTCWTGESESDLVRHLLCFDRKTGEQLWDTPIEPTIDEDRYEGMFQQTGYAAHTPVSDGERIYAFFGRCGIYAFGMEGNELWHKSVGEGSDPRNWGTASSPIVYDGLVIVTAGPESNTIYAFDGATGEEAWKYQHESISDLWGTPLIVSVTDDRDELVLGTPEIVWGLNPTTGEALWQCAGSDDGKSSVFTHDGVVYMFGGGRSGGGSLAVRAGGSGDVNETHVVWRNSQRGGVGTPVFTDGKIYHVSRDVVSAFDPTTGQRIQQMRLEVPGSDVGQQGGFGDRPPRGPGEPGGRGFGPPPRGPGEGRPDGPPAEGQRGPGFGPPPEGSRGDFGPPTGGPGRGEARREGRGGRRFGGRGGFGGNMDYSSPVVADGKIYFVKRNGKVVVIGLGEELEQLAVNSFGSDEADFSASPAIADGQIFVRSTKKLYCVAAEN